MGVILLILVTWQYNSHPSAQIFVTKDWRQCVSLARSFAQSEEEANSRNPWPIREHYYTACEIKNGSDRLEL